MMRKSIVTAALCCVSAPFNPAFAQAKPPPDPSAPQLDDIVVTADRPDSFGADYVQAGTFRDSRLIDTPLTVTVLPKSVLDAQQARSVFDAARNTAGVTQAQLNTTIYSNLSIRGIPVDNTTNFRLNGVLPVITFVDMPMEDKSRVEVLKGAASLYYGFASPSGVVNLVSKRPEADPLTGLEIFGDDHGTIGGAIDISRPLGNAGVRVNAGGASLETGIARTDGHRWFSSAAFDWQATNKLSFQFDAGYIYKTITEPTEYVLPSAVNGHITVPAAQPASRNVGGKWMQAKGWETNLLARARYDFSSSWSASFAVGQSYLQRDRRYSSFSGYDLGTGDGTLSVAMTKNSNYRNVIYRGDITGAFATGPIEHQLLIGASINNRDIEIPAATRFSMAQNLYDPVPVPERAIPPRVIQAADSIRDSGVYIFDRASLGDWLQATIGYRKAHYRDRSLTGVYKTNPDTWSYGVLVKPANWASAYANYIEGLESGGIAQQIAKNAGEQLPAALSKQREIGLKVEPLHRLLLTVAWFQVDRASTYINADGYYVQDGRARYQGIEFGGSGEITPNLSVSMSGVFLDAKQRSGAADIIGNRIENSARFSGSAFVEYKVPMVQGLTINAGIFRVGRRPVNTLNQGYAPGYTTLDLGAGYNTIIAGRSTNFRVYASNVTGKRYWAATGSNLAAPGLPATIRFSISTTI
ncbi:TonB-dependent siderophore receptor [Altererythrobacter indicus]|uniref:TonB-dependent siderophore receptor n=1 Tax=Altericroceibacterium indicum TaxID=374177 RepID=A0A845A8V3_9SPHN|nr:TonB-dependent siderophore receptor [Altericroceibacterium indicum]MXP25947.1 TonB-dependent siderophore receptor [Altericroceibacterium indicum]